MCHFIPSNVISALKNPGVEYWKRLGLTLYGNLRGIRDSTSGEELSQEFVWFLQFFNYT